MKIKISNINIQNHHLLHAAAAKAGYAASIDMADETSALIDLGDEAHRKECGITSEEVDRMIVLMVCFGFSVQKA